MKLCNTSFPANRIVVFAYLPKWTPDGVVWLENVQRHWTGDDWRYTRLEA